MSIIDLFLKPNVTKLKINRDFKGLVKAMKNYQLDLSVRKEAAQALVELKDFAAVPNLIAALRDDDYFVVENAKRALISIDPDWPKSQAARSQLAEFIAVLRDNQLNDKDRRVNAAVILGMIGDPKAIDSLIGAVDEVYTNKPKMQSFSRHQNHCNF